MLYWRNHWIQTLSSTTEANKPGLMAWSTTSTAASFLSFLFVASCQYRYSHALAPLFQCIQKGTIASLKREANKNNFHHITYSVIPNQISSTWDRNMDLSDTKNEQKALSSEELRSRRLVALGIFNAQNITVNQALDVAKMGPNDDDVSNNIVDLQDSECDDDDSDAQRKHPADAPVANKKRQQEVISLLDDDDDDSYIDLMTEFRQIQNRKDLKRQRPALVEKVQRARLDDTTDVFELRYNSDYKRGTATRQSSSSSSDTSSHNEENNVNVASRSNTNNEPASSSTQDRSTWNFKVATWNVWFGREGDGKPHPAPRMRALVRLLKEQSTSDNPLLFIGFQEVIGPLATFLLPALESAGFRVFQQPHATYGCAVAVDKRLEIISHSWTPYSNTMMQRGFYQVRAKLPNKNNLVECPEVVFTTTHLESWNGPHDTGALERVPQLQVMERFCNKELTGSSSCASLAIMTGDMNWDDEQLRGTCIDPVMSSVLDESNHWKDAWLSRPPDPNSKKRNPGYTYDSKINPMLGGNLRRRFDRCLLRGGSNWKSESQNVVLLGQDAIPDLTWQKYNPYRKTYSDAPTAPSDHFGLVAQIQLSK